MKKLRTLSDNTLSELADLIGRISNDVETYSHVSDHLPERLQLEELQKLSDQIGSEIERREEEYINQN
jgi:hypothetical protein